MQAKLGCRSGTGRAARVRTTNSRAGVTCRAAAPSTAAAPAQVDAASFEEFLLEAQQQILTEAEQLDGSGQKFIHDRWERPGDNAGEQGLVLVVQRGLLCQQSSFNLISTTCCRPLGVCVSLAPGHAAPGWP